LNHRTNQKWIKKKKSIHGRVFEQANGIGTQWAFLYPEKKNLYKTPNQKAMSSSVFLSPTHVGVLSLF
jgi:hypothetical protein